MRKIISLNLFDIPRFRATHLLKYSALIRYPDFSCRTRIIMKVTFFFKTDLFDNIISYESYVMKDNNFCSFFPRIFPIVFTDVKLQTDDENYSSQLLVYLLCTVTCLPTWLCPGYTNRWYKFHAYNCHPDNILQFCSEVNINFPCCNIYY